MLAVAYCDSDVYASYVRNRKDKSTLWHLVFALLRDGVTVQTYRKRAKILIQYYPGAPYGKWDNIFISRASSGQYVNQIVGTR